MVEKVTVIRWKTEDGQIFDSQAGAEEHENIIWVRKDRINRLTKILLRNAMINGTEAENIASVIHDNIHAIKNIMGE